MKLKVPKLDWKQKVEKLRKIVLSSVMVEDLPRDMLTLFNTWRAHTHGKITDEEAVNTLGGLDLPAGELLLWEPYSDERGDAESLYGWMFQATLFADNGQPYWLVKANQNSSLAPTEKQVKVIHEAMALLGCHDPVRDLLRAFSDEGGHQTMFWSWFHTGPLLESHFNKKTLAMRVVEEGSPLKEGFMRMERISRKVLPSRNTRS